VQNDALFTHFPALGRRGEPDLDIDVDVNGSIGGRFYNDLTKDDHRLSQWQSLYQRRLRYQANSRYSTQPIRFYQMHQSLFSMDQPRQLG
jgi:hypothetical protein